MKVLLVSNYVLFNNFTFLRKCVCEPDEPTTKKPDIKFCFVNPMKNKRSWPFLHIQIVECQFYERCMPQRSPSYNKPKLLGMELG